MSRSIRNCPVAVVGGAGFLGSHLAEHLWDDRNCNVLVIDNLVAGRMEFIPERCGKRCNFVHHDITGSEDYLVGIFSQYQVEYVFNYSAMPYVPDSYERPLRVFDVNAMGALKVINAAQRAGAKGILQVSSAELYGHSTKVKNGTSTIIYEGEPRRIDEQALVSPHSSYGASKAAIDAMVQVRWREAKTPVIALRQFNCIGERDFMHPYVVPEIARQISHGAGLQRSAGLEGDNSDPITIHLGNNSYRDFLYAGDAVRMATELLEKGEFGGVYNLGSERAISIYELATLIGQIMGVEVRVEEDPLRKRSWEIWHLQSNNTKIYSVVSSRPTVDLEESLRRTLRSFEEAGWKFTW